MPGMGLGLGTEKMLNNQGGLIWTPPQLANLQYWNNTLDAETLTLDGSDYCTEYVEQSQNLYTISQATATARGLYQNARELLYDGADFYNLDATLTNLNTAKGTIMGWATPDDGTPAAAEYIYAFGDTDANEFLYVNHRADGKIKVICRKATVTQWTLDTDNAVFATGVPAHWALRHNGTSADFLINGVVVAQTLTSGADDTAWVSSLTGLDNIRVGALNALSLGEFSFYNGAIGEVLAWSNNLTTAEILQAYNDTLPYFS